MAPMLLSLTASGLIIDRVCSLGMIFSLLFLEKLV